jgi:hypothetical protein
MQDRDLHFIEEPFGSLNERLSEFSESYQSTFKQSDSGLSFWIRVSLLKSPPSCGCLLAGQLRTVHGTNTRRFTTFPVGENAFEGMSEGCDSNLSIALLRFLTFRLYLLSYSFVEQNYLTYSSVRCFTSVGELTDL